ncbi:hypothetical protein Rhow_001315 [Rhodococcus wratislaviensis]|uniref:Uncharacterized protein n=1 Tax=Rhodococcus wratislaviensis TaxID=44752 RepID=A0A402C3W7_RHOWR|nr:hypothetical protein Rhow_001315 [Rhodococcus wratislaviensis]
MVGSRAGAAMQTDANGVDVLLFGCIHDNDCSSTDWADQVSM